MDNQKVSVLYRWHPNLVCVCAWKDFQKKNCTASAQLSRILLNKLLVRYAENLLLRDFTTSYFFSQFSEKLGKHPFLVYET